MEKFEQIKRNHHYVWSYYLKSWSFEDNKVFYISKKGKISCDSVKGLAKDIDFYKINSLNEKDIFFIKKLSSYSSINLQNIHLRQLNYFKNLLDIENYKINKFYQNEQNQLVNTIKSNTLENTYSIIENLALKVISELIEGNSQVLHEDKKMIAFLYFIGHQLSRTKAFKEKILFALAKDDRLYDLWEKNWWFIAYMFGINLGHSLYQNHKKNNHIFIVNNTNLKFITSDSPVINIHSSLNELKKGTAPEHMDLYFPLSPSYAYMINDSDTYNNLKDNINESDVLNLNEYIYKKSYKTVFADSELAIKTLKRYSK
ncbi:DUF4238 domain-containing protein [Arcobacter venerupis]|uniref:DUF4238 domain-containing protein n=1 Tax=Arcobacter venerupis TaxID=1054033 RepID=A0AAE7BAB5_9BACT|nr:DUF4238 domain-containing protein [Arcobacter venerupis]QKF68101.1 DUF4238 domain-containing protein [Arcobacter venerupis]RWS48855.1 hypothetical protein CKA56_12010 [Arcobacter venerupis]